MTGEQHYVMAETILDSTKDRIAKDGYRATSPTEVEMLIGLASAHVALADVALRAGEWS